MINIYLLQELVVDVVNSTNRDPKDLAYKELYHC